MLEDLRGLLPTVKFWENLSPQKIAPAYVEMFDHFFRNFLTRHRITPERNVASTNQIASDNLQCVP